MLRHVTYFRIGRVNHDHLNVSKPRIIMKKPRSEYIESLSSMVTDSSHLANNLLCCSKDQECWENIV